LRDWKRQRARKHTKHRAQLTEVTETIELNKRSTFTTMAPPKKEETSQTARHSRVRTRAQVQSEEGEQQPPEIVNIDKIPSPDTTPMNPIPMVEETQQPTPEGMNVDMPAEEQEQQNQGTGTLKEAQPENPEAALRVNGTTTNQEATVEPDESQTTVSDHPPEGTVEDVMGWPEWFFEVRPMEAGTSSQPLPKKDKQQVPRSPRKQPVVALVFPRIPDGVRVKSDLLGHVEKLKYSDHDVTDTEKFPEFTKKVYLQTVGMNAVGEPIDQPLQWATGLEKTGILGLLELPHFGRGQYTNSCIKQLMAVTHGGDIWLDKLISIDVELIAHITGLPSQGHGSHAISRR
jgi:hypothetical protein